MKYVLIIRFKKIFKNQIIKETSKKNITEKLKIIGLIVKWTHGAGQKCLYCIVPVDIVPSIGTSLLIIIKYKTRT